MSGCPPRPGSPCPALQAWGPRAHPCCDSRLRHSSHPCPSSGHLSQLPVRMTPVAGSLKKGLASVAAPAERQAHFTALQSSHTLTPPAPQTHATAAPQPRST